MTATSQRGANAHESASPPEQNSPTGKHFGFWCLIATQFQGAFNDNALKYLIIYLIVAMGLAPAQRDLLVLVIGALFALPFILLSMAGGFLADRYSKRAVTIGTKVMEIGVMGFAIIALGLRHLAMEAAAVFLLSSQAALFGPSKYGLLPELLPEKELSWGNGILELGTFLAAITATMAAGVLAISFNGRQIWSGVLLLGFTGAGLLASFGISRVPPANQQKKFRLNPFGDLGSQLRLIRKDRVLNWAVLGNTYLWFLAALLQFTIIVYGNDILHVSEAKISYLQAAVGIGIGLGSLLAGYLSGGKIEYGLVPLGAMGMSVLSFFVARPGLQFWHAAFLLSLLGFFGGFFAVPVNALIQHRPDPSQKGGVIAAANLLSFVGVFAAAGAYYLFASAFHLTPAGIFLAGALMTLAASVTAIYLVPDSLLRLILWTLTHSIYRIRVEGRDNVPERGGALLAANHMSFVDACLLIASTDRPIRFLMFQDIYDYPFIKPFAKMLRVIPISSQLRPRDMLRSLRDASEAIQSGEVICIFAEGQISRIGHLLPFRRGFERIMQGLDAPIIPVSLDGIWGSIFSFERGRFFWKMPRRIPYPVVVSFGSRLPPTATHFEVRQAVQDLTAEAYRHHKKDMRLLHRAFINTARHFPWRFAMADARVPRLRFGAALARTIFLATRLRGFWSGQQSVGILLPPSTAGALVNFAALLLGKIPVNLNYTASEEILAACTTQCGLETVLTSQAFLERVSLRLPCRILLLEDVAPSPSISEQFFALLRAILLPARWLEHSLGNTKRPSLDDRATVIFSSGSTGDPKGVMLSHSNIGSNIEQIGQTFMLRPGDRLLGVLPFFHSFGFTVTLWLPAVLGVGVVYHPNPLDMTAISELTRKYRVTFLLATPTFLQAYIRRCQPEDFGTLRYVVVGAEKLPDRIAAAFEDRFGIRPVEGYGCTECSPVVSVNHHDFRAPGFRQVGAKRGSIGHPLPGISVRFLDPETNQPVPFGNTGLLWVRGPNVMQGYLDRPDKTAEVLRDGWYNTGDIAKIDEEGFLIITDRLSRFSKIGGEMVPHIRIEEKLHELADVSEQTFVVTGIPDEKKGERIVVLHILDESALNATLEKLSHCDLPKLWVPRDNQFFHVASLPVLGTGKLDLRRIRELASQLCSQF